MSTTHFSNAPKVGSVNEFGSTDHHFEEVQKDALEGEGPRAFHYVVTGSTRMVYASAVRAGIIAVVSSMSAAADVLAMSTIEVPLTGIQKGTTLTVKWRGKPVFIRHRTQEEIDAAGSTALEELKDPQADTDRAQKPEWLVVLGVCTHLGCVPLANQGDYNGWFCPCHGSHYDTSGRIRKGPAPLNLEVPVHKFLTDTTMLIG